VDAVLRRIASSELVVGTSLHGIVLAEAFGIPARLIRPGVEPMLKYQDYYGGTGRERFTVADSVEDAIHLGGEVAPSWDAEPLLGAFPEDLWTATNASRE
jgi:pyruvyltransferase